MAEPSRVIPTAAEVTVAEFSRVARGLRDRTAPLRSAQIAGAEPVPLQRATPEQTHTAEEELRAQNDTLQQARAQAEQERAARVEAEAAARAGAELVRCLTTELHAALQSSVGYVEVLRGRGRDSASGAAGEMQRAATDSVLALHEYMLGLVADASRTAACAAVALAPAGDPPPRAEDA